MIGFMLTVVSGSIALAQTNFYTNVTNLWYQGYKTSNALRNGAQNHIKAVSLTHLGQR